MFGDTKNIFKFLTIFLFLFASYNTYADDGADGVIHGSNCQAVVGADESKIVHFWGGMVNNSTSNVWLSCPTNTGYKTGYADRQVGIYHTQPFTVSECHFVRYSADGQVTKRYSNETLSHNNMGSCHVWYQGATTPALSFSDYDVLMINLAPGGWLTYVSSYNG